MRDTHATTEKKRKKSKKIKSSIIEQSECVIFPVQVTS